MPLMARAMHEDDMDYELLWNVSDRARRGERLAIADVKFIRDEVPRDLSAFPRLTPPKKFKHPAGFSLSGAPVHSFLRCALVLGARRALGPKYARISEFYERVETDLAMRIMRSNFHAGDPKGTYCCAQCTLAVYPVLQAGAIRWFDGPSLARAVRRLIEAEQWAFRSSKNGRMLAWALGAG